MLLHTRKTHHLYNVLAARTFGAVCQSFSNKMTSAPFCSERFVPYESADKLADDAPEPQRLEKVYT